MIPAILKFAGPLVIRLLSDQMVQRLAMSAAHTAIDLAEKRLIEQGHRPAAEALQAVEAELFADPTPLADAAFEAAKSGVIVPA